MHNSAGRERVAAVLLPTKYLLPILACLILAIALLFIVRFQFPPGWDFMNNLWAPGHLLLQGKSPYNISVINDVGSAVWMPPAIGIFWPIGILPLQQASNVWWIITLIALITVVWLSSGKKHPPKFTFVVTLFLVFLFPPTISHFSLGQVTILTSLVLIVISVYGHRLHPFIISVLIALALSKPQLTIFVLPGFFLYYLREKGLPRTLQLGLYSILAVAITSLPLFFFYPQWIPDFIRNQITNPSWAHPSSLFILQSNFKEIGQAIWWLFLLVGSGVNLFLWARLPKREAAAWSLALTTLITPYVWSWDFVLLIPLLVIYLFRKLPGYAKTLIYFGIIACWGVLAFLKFSGYTSDELYWWVPWYLVGLILLVSSLDWIHANTKTNLIFNPKFPYFHSSDDQAIKIQFRP